MFSQKKSFFKGKLFYIIMIGLFAFGYWINQPPTANNSPDDVNTDSKYPVSTESAVDNSNDPNQYDIMDNIIGGRQYSTPGGLGNPENEDSAPEDNTTKGYYLIKEVDGIIQIFYYDEQGKESLIRTTDIAFSLLSVADQALFQQGVMVHSMEELDELLQDFES
ncbi:hypothetical protein KCX82_01670 [Clostridiales bacterium BAD-6]|uniref:Bypass of forespore C C-terminal domain-containing protein n=2 Tax=Sinanaerobacter chloroacetimidivorans TaxID=2818044 RepID=A0A8J8AZI7_9FIRM|nr:hypothetical protein [Sinanaerobacter chloroacetimidivorans]